MRVEQTRATALTRWRRGRVRFCSVWPSRLLPVVITWLGAATILQSAILVASAFAQSSGTTATQNLDRPPGAASSNHGQPHAKTYWPVTNWTDRPPPPPSCKPDPLSETGERAILLDLKSRAATLHIRALAIAREEQELDTVKAALRQQVAAIKPLAARLEALKAQRRSVDDAKWSGLVQTYGAMEPQSAARIFDGLDPQIVFNVLRRMNNRKSAAILASMAPEKAQAITERLAGESSRPVVQPTDALLPDGAP